MHKSCVDGVYDLVAAEDPLPLIFDSPHSGTQYPDDFDYACDRADLERTADLYVDDLFSNAPDMGGCLLSAQFPRCYLDLNRARDDIDPEIYDGDWPYKDMPANPTNRSYAGIGLIRRLVRPGEPVYGAYLSPEAIKSRIETYFEPYHAVLGTIIDGAHYRYGQVWHLNCHSMPSPERTSGALSRVNPVLAPDFVLGDRDGTTCDIGFTHAVRDFIKSLGYKVAINDPYKGVELVERYSDPARGRHSLQIEISRALYMDEETGEKSKNYKNLKADITKLIQFCVDYAQSNLTQIAAD